MTGLLTWLNKLRGKGNNRMRSPCCTSWLTLGHGQCGRTVCSFSISAYWKDLCLLSASLSLWWHFLHDPLQQCHASASLFHVFRESSSGSYFFFLNQPHVPFFPSLVWGKMQSSLISALSLLADLGTSSTKKRLSTVAATTLGCVLNGASAFPSWIRRLV